MGMQSGRWIVSLALTALLISFVSSATSAEDGASSSELRKLREEIQRLKQESETRIEQLQQRIEEVEKQSTEKQKQLETAVNKPPSASTVEQALGRYWGESRFQITGYGFLEHDWDRNANSNSFTAGFNPIFLFRLNDWILFQSELEVKLPDDAETEVNLEFAEADLLLNDYVTFVGGKYLLPFGDFIERLHPPWINKLVTHPLPFREGDEGGLLPFSEIGVALRGGVPLAMIGDGARFEYTVYGGNGPNFDGDDIGASFTSNNVDNNRGKSIGARVALLPLPVDASAGRLEIGGSTYNGQWNANGNWVHAAGVHGFYQLGNAGLRGEYIHLQRNMPDGADLAHDNREGWYIQGSYRLADLGVPYVDRTELVARYDGQNQRATTDEELNPHPRRVAIGVDYWFRPSVVFKLEYDRVMPREGKDDNAIESAVALGF